MDPCHPERGRVMEQHCIDCLYWRHPHAEATAANHCYSWRWQQRGGGSRPDAKAPPPDLDGVRPACKLFAANKTKGPSVGSARA
jgi:hypothetical protein